MERSATEELPRWQMRWGGCNFWHIGGQIKVVILRALFTGAYDGGILGGVHWHGICELKV
jgi:hypothetical protein